MLLQHLARMARVGVEEGLAKLVAKKVILWTSLAPICGGALAKDWPGLIPVCGGPNGGGT